MKKFLIVISLLAISIGAMAQDSKWKVRFRLTSVDPTDSSTTIAGSGRELSDGSFGPETYADVNSNITPELDITYSFTEHWALELILATTKHDLIGVDGIYAGADLGTAKLLPPTFTAQYFVNPDGDVQFYVGAGLNITSFISYDLSEDLANEGVTDMDFSDSVGISLSTGFDGYINDHWLVNVDLKYIQMSTDVDIQTAAGILDTLEVDLNPWLVSVGVGYHF